MKDKIIDLRCKIEARSQDLKLQRKFGEMSGLDWCAKQMDLLNLPTVSKRECPENDEPEETADDE